MACSYRYGAALLLSTTIQEEEEEDIIDTTTACSSAKPQPAVAQNVAGQGCCYTGNTDEQRAPISHGAVKDRPLSRFAACAVASIATATLKLVNRIMHGHQRRSPHVLHSHRCRDEMVAVNVLKAYITNKAHDDCSAGNHRVHSRRGTCSLLGHLNPVADVTSGKAKQLRSDSQKHYAQRHFQESHHRTNNASEQHGRHLVRLMDGDDVRLALQALQLAAQIHDQVWGQGGANAGDGETPGSRRDALLEAASPLYDTAMAAARAIQHRALHSLVKQAVRRYVNPYRGSPDDVLRVILELLTGCGGGAAASPMLIQSGKAATTAAAGNRVTSRRLSDVGSGNRGCCRDCTPEDEWSPSPPSPPLDHSDGLSMCSCSSSSSTRRSPNCCHQRISCGSSPGGRSSTRSSLDSSGNSDSSSVVAVGLRS